MRPTDLAWYCLRSQPKHEHIAAANLVHFAGVEVFNPRIRLRRPRRTGPMWVTESLFPNYLFARFALQPHLDVVRYISGVKCIVRFGEGWPSIPDPVIHDLKQRLGDNEWFEQPPELEPGDEVNIVSGPFMGLSAVVQRYMPGPQRVRVLLDMLGRTTPVDVNLQQLSSVRRYPEPLLVRSDAA